jgi:hypothetical protein
MSSPSSLTTRDSCRIPIRPRVSGSKRLKTFRSSSSEFRDFCKQGGAVHQQRSLPRLTALHTESGFFVFVMKDTPTYEYSPPTHHLVAHNFNKFFEVNRYSFVVASAKQAEREVRGGYLYKNCPGMDRVLAPQRLSSTTYISAIIFRTSAFLIGNPKARMAAFSSLASISPESSRAGRRGGERFPYSKERMSTQSNFLHVIEAICCHKPLLSESNKPKASFNSSRVSVSNLEPAGARFVVAA